MEYIELINRLTEIENADDGVQTAAGWVPKDPERAHRLENALLWDVIYNLAHDKVSDDAIRILAEWNRKNAYRVRSFS